MGVDDFDPLFVGIVRACKHVFGAVRVGRLDDPVFARSFHVAFGHHVARQKRGERHRIAHEGIFLVGEQRLGFGHMKHLENLFVVHQMAREAADERHLALAHGRDKRLRRLPVVDDVVGHAAAPNGVDFRIVAAIERLLTNKFAVLERQIAHVVHRALNAALGEQASENLELFGNGIFQEVDNCNMRIGDLQIVGVVDFEELVHPSGKQLFVARTNLVGRGERFEGLGIRDARGDFTILVHARRTVGVEFAELRRHVVFVQEQVHARKRQQRVVAARQQNKLHQARIDIVYVTIAGVFQILAHDLRQNRIGVFGDIHETLVRLTVVQARHVRRVHHLVVVNRSRIVHVLARGKAALRVAATFSNKREVFIGELGVSGHELFLLSVVYAPSIRQAPEAT